MLPCRLECLLGSMQSDFESSCRLQKVCASPSSSRQSLSFLAVSPCTPVASCKESQSKQQPPGASLLLPYVQRQEHGSMARTAKARAVADEISRNRRSER